MMEYFKSFVWVDYFFYTLVEPRRLLSVIKREIRTSFPLGIMVIAFVSIIEIITFSLLGQENSFFYFKITYGWILLFFIYSLGIAILASLIDLFCQFRGYVGSMKNIVNLINFSLFPRIFILPVVLIFKVFRFAPIFFYLFFMIILIIWQSLIIIQGISELHRISFSESVMSFLFPIIFIGSIIFFSIILIAINLAGYISLI